MDATVLAWSVSGGRGSELSHIARLATGAALTNLCFLTMNVVDTIMVGHLSRDAIAGTALASTYSFALAVFAQGVFLALDTLVARAEGAGDTDAIRTTFHRGMVVAVALAIPVAGLMLAGETMLGWLGQPASALPHAGQFLRATAPAVPAMFLFVVHRQVLQGMSAVAPAVAAAIVANLINALLDWALIFGKLGMPALGVTGAGLATTIARWTMLLVMIVLTAPVLRPLWHKGSGSLRDLASYRQILRLGAPLGLQWAIEFWLLMLVALFMGRFGSSALAGHAIALSLVTVSFTIPNGVGAAAAVRVGHAIGRSDAAALRVVWRTVNWVGGGAMLFTMAAFALIPGPLASVYTEDLGVRAAAVSLLPIAAGFQIADGLQAVNSGMLRGLSDTRAAALINLGGYWLVGLPLGLALTFGLDLGPRGLWLGLTLGLFTICGLMLWRVRNRIAATAAAIQDRGRQPSG